MREKKLIYILVLITILLTLLWGCIMIEITTLVSYENFFTAGELFAWITANPYEVNDIENYCIRYVSPYWLVCTFIFIGTLAFIWTILRHSTRNRIIAFLIFEILFLLPFVALPLHCNIVREANYVVKQIRDIKRYSANSTDFHYNSYKAANTSEREIYVLAIGESVRYRNLSLNGIYSRETTPLLKKQNNFVPYCDYYANATLTQHAMPMLLTDVRTNNFEQHFTKKTIAAAFSEAGYRTALVSHRAQLMNNGYHDYLARDFDTVLFVEHDSLIAPAAKMLMDKEKKLFVVTHYLGNHMFYTNRTDDCLRWRPDYNADKNEKNDSLFVNAYDNSLLYTDRLLYEFINMLDSTDAVSAWLFVSDHGEFISHKVSGHGHTYHPQKDEYHVPFLVWYSDKYNDTYPDKVANMIKHKNEPTSADNVFWSVLDMGAIKIENQQSGYSIFEKTLQPHKRTLLLPDGRSKINL